jgi:hypothetical protein
MVTRPMPNHSLRLHLVGMLALECFFVGNIHAADALTPIDRHALVSRHDIDWPDLTGKIPLGNGNFAFNADGTGLETVTGNTMSHWCWHHFPLPPGVTRDDIKPWATPDHGHLTGKTTKSPDSLYDWERNNPQPLNLGRIGFIDTNGIRLDSFDIKINSRHLDLWTGLLTSHFTYRGQPVTVETCIDPKSDTVAAHVVSPLLSDGSLRILLDFPAPARGNHAFAGDFVKIAGHQTEVVNSGDGRLDLNRVIDDAHYQVALAGSGFTVGPFPAATLKIEQARFGSDQAGWTDVTAQVAALQEDGGIEVPVSATTFDLDPAAPRQPRHLEITYLVNGNERTTSVREKGYLEIPAGLSPHRFIIASRKGGDTIDLTCHFGLTAATDPISTVAEIKEACATSWPAFWKSGGAVDLSGSKDPRWMELERRIVLSQYELAVQSAGDNPPAESGLDGLDGWWSKWHFEMIWWHLAHYALWDRWPMAEKALTIYQRIAPEARAIATNFDYKGLEWPKSTGPEGYNDGYPQEMPLLWREPHPIFFAELDYRLHPTAETLQKWKDVVFGTADFMADYPTRDANGQYNLENVWPETEGSRFPTNPVFELGYWRVGLEMAQQWRIRLGLPRDPHWDDVLNHLAPLPVKDGLYIYDSGRTDTYTLRRFSHLDIISSFATLPMSSAVDPTIAHNTVKEVARSWQWDGTWGWDFPLMAMASARVGEPNLAVDALLNPSIKNQYDERGLNVRGSAPYLPANGGLLYAVAMMAAGWDGAPKRNAPGFPDDGSWDVRWEDLKTAP